MIRLNQAASLCIYGCGWAASMAEYAYMYECLAQAFFSLGFFSVAADGEDRYLQR